jgi:HAMP domain-containing protein
MIKKIFKFSTLRMQLVGSVLLLITPAWLVMYIFNLEFSGFVVGLLALAAAWFGGEHFIMHQVRALSNTAKKITEGDLTARTGLKTTENELGQLTELFDRMAESLERYVKKPAEPRLPADRGGRPGTICADQQRPGSLDEPGRHARGANLGHGILRSVRATARRPAAAAGRHGLEIGVQPPDLPARK